MRIFDAAASLVYCPNSTAIQGWKKLSKMQLYQVATGLDSSDERALNCNDGLLRADSMSTKAWPVVHDTHASIGLAYLFPWKVSQQAMRVTNVNVLQRISSLHHCFNLHSWKV